MKTVFVVQHLHVLPDGQECVKLIGAYSSRETAQEAIGRVQVQHGFCNHPRIINPLTDDEEEGFYISEYEIDKDHWEEGFVTENSDSAK